MDSKKLSYQISVKKLVSFVLRTGGLRGEAGCFRPRRGLEGTRGHQKIQNSRPADYEKEVSISMELESELVQLQIKGRIDGLWRTKNPVLLEEIKTVTEKWNGIPDILHWAQARIYAYLAFHENPLDRLDIQLTYLELESDQLTVFRESHEWQVLEAFFKKTVAEYLEWLDRDASRRLKSQESIRQTNFPFRRYREGQRRMMTEVFKAIRDRSRLFCEAPTGIGKTISVIFPSLKALAENHLHKIFYLTAKTSTRFAAESAIQELQREGIHLISIVLTAKEKICFEPEKGCLRTECPYADGYYDRYKPAVRKAMTGGLLNAVSFQALGEEFQVCPYQLSLDTATWSDLIIGDYNYLFDPQVRLKQFFSEGTQPYCFLIDEAHNLVDRTREIYSAEIDTEFVQRLSPVFKKTMPSASRLLKSIHKEMERSFDSEDLEPKEKYNARVGEIVPGKLLRQLKKLMEQMELFLEQNNEYSSKDTLLGGYFRILKFLRIAEVFDETFVCLYRKPGKNLKIRLFCSDPSAQIKICTRLAESTVFFSASLSPIQFHLQSVGGDSEDRILQLPSPFPKEHLEVYMESRISTRYRNRDSTYPQVAWSLQRIVNEVRGNHLFFFPSFHYLQQIQERFVPPHEQVRICIQNRSMSETDRSDFLDQFQADSEISRVGFVVMGGIFAEGIDLIGDRLIGAAIVSVGLPPVCLEREIIKDYFDASSGSGFDCAYTYPGFSRVIQAAGRVIRSESDKGTILLIDDRFASAAYRSLFPAWWNPVQITVPFPTTSK
ncbi:MAG TPA: ATP-dependent DNA helicase [Verrucomicrobiales bacterium]|nr:ATP-dependent DNA helicase [Verrucomicrobiales bacterium]